MWWQGFWKDLEGVVHQEYDGMDWLVNDQSAPSHETQNTGQLWFIHALAADCGKVMTMTKWYDKS